MARHRLMPRKGARQDAFQVAHERRTVRLVHVADGVEHRLTQTDYDAGQSGAAPYVALCGEHVLAAALATPERRSCRECVAQTIPAQRRW